VIIGVDIDNTITHTTEMIMHYAKIYGEEQGLNTVPDLRYYYLEDALGWKTEYADDFFDKYLGRIYNEMKPKDQTVEVLSELKKQHELILITSRNSRFPQVEEVTINWLKRNKIAYDRLILNATSNMHFFSKLAVCQELQVDIMIEDHYELVSEISSILPVIMFEYPYNRHLLQSANIIPVRHWYEVKQWIDSFQTKKMSV
jgi:uncharacterized HAD superfamily protein